MKLLSQLKAAHRKNSKRLGRGKGSGKGGTSTKGHKGQKARSGVNIPRGFEGGGMPLARRLPKFGFTNKKFKKEYTLLSLSHLNQFEGEKVVISDMIQKKLVKKNSKIKVLNNGSLEKTLIVEAHSFSASAKKAIEAKGGKAVVVSDSK